MARWLPGASSAPAGASFATLEAPNLQMVTFKEAEDGDGWILRFREVAGRPGSAELKLPLFDVRKASLCNGVEDIQRPLPCTAHSVTVPYKPSQFITIRLQLETGTARMAGG